MSKISLYGDHETSKKTTRSVLAHVLDQTLRMLHPYMPFITEEIWQQLPHEGDSITVVAWPERNEQLSDPVAVKEMENIMAIIRSVRNIRAEVDTPLSKQIVMYIKAKDEETVQELKRNELYIDRFCKDRKSTRLNSSHVAISYAVF